MAQNNNDEIDLGVVFRKLKEQYRNFLIWLYHCVQFVIRNIIILLVLLVVGIAAGYFWKENSKGEKITEVIIQNNFNSTNYVYNAILILKSKSKQGDLKFLSKYGFKTDEIEIKDLEITPIVNILDLAKKTKDEDRTFEEYMAQTDFEDDILLSEVFYTEYTYHRLLITGTHVAGDETIKSLINYLNSSDLYQEIKAVSIEETKAKIARNEKSIKDIEGVFESYVDSNAVAAAASQVYFKNNENNNLHFLLEEKRIIMDEIEKLKIELIKYDDVVSLINQPKFVSSVGILDRKTILVPFFLIFFFVAFSVIRSTYRKAKGWSDQRDR
ncbi:hypothetical protein [Constantimarinum furrinae]|uniref:Uncharacterized protein n=1 Tax=Constantimarinum furrinae TaxID=2562285 RepID=A0A7G8PT15_9FLAO|nr:hypothetical protein [Constantimarinum furrinae]QNJ97481.1 hypothetical protein ALE3EI_0906 [Constantimarinum furrinae]